MSNFAVWGPLGAGKTKYAVWCARTALESGRRVASNIDLRLDALTKDKARSYIRVPDKPTAEDLFAIGNGNPHSYDEDRNGVLILDELATWLNSRSFQDKGRAGVLDWLVHSRKHGWDVYFLMQNPSQVDKQVRESLLQYSVHMAALDKVRIPMVGWMAQRVGLRGTFAKGSHWAQIRMGLDPHGLVVDSVIFKGNDLHAAYDTRQVFVLDPEARCYSVLHPDFFKRHRAVVDRLRRSATAYVVEPKAKLPHVKRLEVLPADVRAEALRYMLRLANLRTWLERSRGYGAA